MAKSEVLPVEAMKIQYLISQKLQAKKSPVITGHFLLYICFDLFSEINNYYKLELFFNCASPVTVPILFMISAPNSLVFNKVAPLIKL